MVAEIKNVIHVTTRWGHGNGGVKSFIHNAEEALPKERYRQTVASIGLVTGDSQGSSVLGPISRNGSLFGVHIMRDMVTFFKEQSPDIVHIHCNNGLGLLCAEAARRAHVPVRVTHSHSSSLGGNEFYKRISDRLFKMLFTYSPTERVACSKLAGDWLFGNASFRIVRNGIAIDLFAFSSGRRLAVRAELGIGLNSIVIGLVGAGVPVKNSGFALDILAELLDMDCDAHLLLLGEGTESPVLHKKAISMGLSERAHFTGTVMDPWRWYSAMDVLVMPSFFEGLPITLVEAQANGLPCVVSDVISAESDVTGLLCPLSLDDPHEWAELVCTMAKSGARRTEATSAIEANKVRSAGYSLEDLGVQLEKLYGGAGN